MNVLLDLDGTLTDPRDGILNCIREALTRLGQPVGVLWGYSSASELTDAGADCLCEEPSLLPAAVRRTLSSA